MANGKYEKILTNQPTSSLHQKTYGFCSGLFFGWMTDIFKTGSTRPLEKADLLPLEEENKTRALTEKLQNLWNEERIACRNQEKRPRLWRSVVKMIPAKEVALVVLFGIVDTICRTLQPLLIGIILWNLISQTSDKSLLYACVVLMGVVNVGRSLALHSRNYLAEVWGVQLSSALKGIMYSKTIVVGLQALQEFQKGHVIDLLSNDIQRIVQAPGMISNIIPLFYFIPLVVYLFINLFYWKALAGVAFLLALAPYFILNSYFIGKLRKQTALVSDKRIAVMDELLSGIRAVKAHAWENNYRENVAEIRRQEIGKIRAKSVLMSGVQGTITASASVAVFLSVLLVILSNKHVSPIDAFMLLSFMNLLRVSFSIYLGSGLQWGFEAFVSLNRIEEFLLLDNLSSLRNSLESLNGLPKDDNTLNSFVRDSHPSDKNPHRLSGDTDVNSEQIKHNNRDEGQERVASSSETDDALVISNVSYRLNETDGSNYLLQNISFVSPKNTITILCGQVGSGKSTLLSAIAGEVDISSGTVTYPGCLAYVPQVPWVFSGTINENILFGEPYYHDWYTTVIEACELKEDIAQFPDGDETTVGERGAVLSGGQKARVSLARAVYSYSDVYLLDDPLSSVDQKVAEQIFDKCICGLLSNKIRVVVSHNQKHFADAGQIVVLDNGCVLKKGAPAQVKLTQDTEGTFPSICVGDDQLSQFTEKESLATKTYDCVREGLLTDQSAPDKPKGLDIPDEDRVVGNVSFHLYWEYFKSGWHPVFLVLLIALFVFSQTAVVSPDVWLTILSKKTLEQQQKMVNLIIYASLTAGSLLLAVIPAFLFYFASLSSSKRLHDKMVAAALYTQLLFFDTNPTGRILNRFSRDVGSMDEELPQACLVFIQHLLLVVTTALVPTVANPWLVFALSPTLVVFAFFARYYLKTSRELKRLESICRSPVFSHFSETMTGLETIRTRGMEEEFIDQFYRKQDLHSQAFFMVFQGARWFGIRVDLLCVPFVTCVALAIVLLSMDAALAGLSLATASDAIEYTQYTVRQFSEVENLMTSVERVISYTKLESEPGYENKRRPPTQWPCDGQVAFDNVSLTYYEGGPQVLKNLNFNIREMSKIGVVGRTGAGKSSFVAALLRMPDAQGDIIIDGVSILDINLQEARRCISVLGQVPVLFRGSLRKNLDPLNQHKDHHLWAALEDVRLKSLVKNFHEQLDYELLEGGANLSVGERQLVCLARILLQNKKVVILDEPTAHVDPITEQIIWNTVHDKLKDCTVITIAHRLDTIKDSDMILVLKDGQVVEYGVFDSLLRQGGELAGMVKNAQE